VVISLGYNGGVMSNPLQKEFQFYLDHQDELVKKYDGKFIVIKGGKVLGAYDDELTAITETEKSEKIGTFLVQKVSKGESAYTQTFHSRVVFS
jgi:hypothetical protein